MESIAALNNHGVAAFTAGDLPLALDLFRRSLQATIGGLQPTDQAQVPPSSDPAPHVHYSAPSSSSSPPERPTLTEEASLSMMNAYTRAINLIPSSTAYSQDPLVNTTIVASIVLFNLALVYHIKGMEGFDNASEGRIHKARSLYNKARSLLSEAGLNPCSSTGHPLIDILSMAILNNLGQSAHYLSEYQHAQAHFEELVVYASTVSTKIDNVEASALLEWHKSIFLMNAVALQPPVLASAA